MKLRMIKVFTCIGMALFIGLATLATSGVFAAKADDKVPEAEAASIGFVVPNKNDASNASLYLPEKNSNAETVRISISEPQTTDTMFSLSESIVIPDFSLSPNYYEDIQFDPDYQSFFDEWESYWNGILISQGNVFQYEPSYILPAGQNYVDIVLLQNANAESISETRLRQIMLNCSATNVIAGYEPTETGIRSILDVVIYDTNSLTNTILLVPNSAESHEKDGFRAFKIIRTGDNSIQSIAPSFQYKLLNYNINNPKELKFEVTQSTYVFSIVGGVYEREANLKLKFFDNDYLNWQSVYTLQLSNFVNCGTQYLNNNKLGLTNFDNNFTQTFFVQDDELELINHDAMVVLNLPQSNPFIRPEENFDAVLPENGETLGYEIYTRPSTGKGVAAYRLFYSVSFENTTALLGTDFNLPQNYSATQNVGFVDFASTEINQDSIGLLSIEIINNNLLDGARTLQLQFFISAENNKILLPAKDFLLLAIWDDEHLAENNTISWANSMIYTGVQLIDGAISFNSTYPNCYINLTTNYNGGLDYAIPIEYTDITAKIGTDYNKPSHFDILSNNTFINNEQEYDYWGTNLNVLNNGLFYGAKQLRATILTNLLPAGFTLEGPESILINLIGDYEKDYFYVTEPDIQLHRDEDILLILNRSETSAYTTYINLENTNLIEGVHYQTDLFPFAVNWQSNQTQQTVAIPLLNFVSSETDFSGTFVFQNSQQNNLQGSFENKYCHVNLTLINAYEHGAFYFGLTDYTYFTSIGSLFVEVLRTSSVGMASVNYSLAALTGLTENQMAEIGVDINNIQGSLTFLEGQTLKTIAITIPTITRKIENRQIGLVLSEPSRYSTIAQEQTVITIDDDTWPTIYLYKQTLSYADLLGQNPNQLRFFPVTHPASSASFKVGITSNNLPVDAYTLQFVMYAVGDASAQGIDVWIDNEQINATLLALPFTYLDVTYYYSYSFSAQLSKDNPSFTVSFKYETIYDILPVFAGNMFCVTAQSETIADTLTPVTITALTSTANMPTITMTVDDEIIGSNDSVAITVSRNWENTYLRQNFRLVASGGMLNMYQPLNTVITFEPFETSKTILFYSGQGTFRMEDPQPIISLYNSDNQLISQKGVVILSESESPTIKLDAFKLGDSDFVSVDYEQTVQVLFRLSRAWNQEIIINISNLPAPLSTTPIVFAAGTLQVVHNFVINGLLLDQYMTDLFYERSNFPETVNGIDLSLRFFSGRGWVALSNLSELGLPTINFNKTELKETETVRLTLSYNAGSTPVSELPEKLVYCKLDGTAIYGQDYNFQTAQFSPNYLVYNSALEAFVIPAGQNSITIYINTSYDGVVNVAKTMVFSFYELTQNNQKFAEREYIIDLFNSDKYGNLTLTPQQTDTGYDLVITNTNNTGMPMDIGLLLENYVGVYGVDYTISNYDLFNPQTHIFTLNFTGQNETKVLHIAHLTNVRCVFDLVLTNFPLTHIELLTQNTSFTLMPEIPASVINEHENPNKVLYWQTSNEHQFYFNYYDEAYNKYLLGNQTFVVNQVDVYGTGNLYDVIYTYKIVGGKIETTVKIANGTTTSNEFVIPSAIKANIWQDINNDGIKEMLYISCYPYSFYGGMAEFDDFNKYGVFYIDFANNASGAVLNLSKLEVTNKFVNIFLIDLTDNGQTEISVFVQNSSLANDNLNHLLGSNSLFIVSNTSQTEIDYEIVYFNSGIKVIDDMQMRLVLVDYHVDDYEVDHIVLKYIKQGDWNNDLNRLNSGYKIISQSLYGYERFKNISINQIPTAVSEDEYLTFNVYNPSESAGKFTITYQGITAVAGRDFALSGTITYSFAQGERNKQISFLILNNYLPSDNLTFKITINSTDFYLGNRTENIVKIIDRTIVTKNIIYTVLDNFNVDKNTTNAAVYQSNYTYITGDEALISVRSLMINGLSAFNTSRYFPRMTATFNGFTVVDTEHKGYFSLSNLIELSAGHDGTICVTIDFLAKNGTSITSTVLTSMTVNIPYIYHQNNQTESVIVANENISVGQNATVSVRSSFGGSRTDTHNISVTYTNTINDTIQTYHCDENGVVTFQINGGNFSSSYSNTIKINNYTTGQTETFEHVLNVYGEKINLNILASSTIDASVLSAVQVRVVGQDVNFLAEGRTDSETGLFTVALIPFKTYNIYFNEGNDINYFNEGVVTLSNATFQNSTLNISLTLRNNNTQIKNVNTFVLTKRQVIDLVSSIGYEYFNSGGYGIFNGMAMGDTIYNYINGTLRRELKQTEQIALKCFFEALNDRNTYVVSEESNRNERLLPKYEIPNDIFIGNPELPIYKTLTKETPDVVIFYYEYYPVFSDATITLTSAGLPLTSANAVMANYNKINNLNQSFQQSFVARTGIKDNLINMEIVSNAYATGKKTVQLVAFGNGLGAMLAAGINEALAAAETAEVPAWVKFLDGMSFALSFNDQEVGFQINEEEMTISIYIGLSKGIFERSHGASYANQDRPTLAELRSAKDGGNLGTGRGSASLGLGLGGKLHFKYHNGAWRLLAGEIIISVSASYNYTKYIMVPVINFPAFFSATVSLTMTNTIMFDWNDVEYVTDVTGELAFELALEIEVGLGIRGLLSASVFARGSIEVVIQYHTGGAKLTLAVAGGLRVQIIFWKQEYIFAETRWSTQSDGYIERGSTNVYLTQLKELVPSTSYAGEATVFANNGELMMQMILNDDGAVEDVTVVENIFDAAVPQIAELADGTKMIAWINQDSARGVTNSELINYIYFDGQTWSNVMVMDPSITADLYFDLKAYGNTFAIAYSEVKRSLSSSATLSQRLQLSEIAFSVFNKQTMSFNKTQLTDNDFNDRIVMFEMFENTGIMVIYQSQNENIHEEMTLNDFLCGEDSNNKLLYSIYLNGSWGEFKVLQNSLPAIVNLSLKVVGGIAYIALETDNDNNFDTTADREILLVQYIFANKVIALRAITNNNVADTDPVLAAYNNKLMLMFKSENDVVCYYNNQFSYITTLPAGQPTFSLFANDTYAVLLWSAAVEGKTQIFASIMTAEANVFSAPYQVTTGTNSKSNPFATMHNGNLLVYYCEDIFTPIGTDGDFSVSRNIKVTAVDLFSDLEIDVLTLDTSSFVPGSEQTITIRIYNNGNLAAINPTIFANMLGVITTFNVSATIPGMSFIDYELTLVMPQNKTTVHFSIEDSGLAETNLNNNSSSIDIMKFDLAISGFSITKTQTGLQVQITVQNKSHVNAFNVVLSITRYSNTSMILDSHSILSFPAQTQQTHLLHISNSDITYNAVEVFWSKIFILTEGETIYTENQNDYNTENNMVSLSLKRAQLEGNETLVVLNETLTLLTNQTFALNYIYTGSGTLTFTSDNEQVVSIVSNKVTALADGTATISITDGTVTKTVIIQVESNNYTLALNGSSTVTLLRGQTYTESGVITSYNGQPTQGDIRVTHTLDTNIIGRHVVLYQYIVSGNVVASATRTVVVKPQQAFATFAEGIISGYALNNSTVVLYNNLNAEIARTTAVNGQFSFENFAQAESYQVVVLVQDVQSDSFTILGAQIDNPIIVSPEQNNTLYLVLGTVLALLAIGLPITLIALKKRARGA